MTKKKIGNRVYITTEPKVAVYVPTEEDHLYGLKGTQTRTLHENCQYTEQLQLAIYNAMLDKDLTPASIAEAIGCKESTIDTLIKDPSKSLFSIILKVYSYLNIELDSL